MSNDDRTVHCTIVPSTGGPRIEIVRYNRAGKWFYESRDARKSLTIDEAAHFASDTRPSVIWHEGRPGGKTFDARVRKARQARMNSQETK